MFEEEMPESDSSDEDFVPTGDRSDVSEEESDDAVDDKDCEEINSTVKRKKSGIKPTKANRKKKRKDSDEEKLEEKVQEVKEVTVEEKKKADDLWADFLKDCGPVKKSTDSTPAKSLALSQPVVKSEHSRQDPKIDSLSQSDSLSESSKNCDRVLEGANADDKTEDQGSSDKVVEVFEFAGEKVLVEKKLDPRKRPVGRGGGVSAILGQLNKKSKLSTLEKSKLDWDTFKEKEGIKEELSAHNRGKNGFLEKQDFLERADLRQFEIEKQMRAYSRTKRL